eukprot:s330_g18.t1
MVAVMMPAIAQIDREFPAVIQRSFVDDRSWAAPTANMALQVEAIWTSWSIHAKERERLVSAKSMILRADVIFGTSELDANGA